LTTGVRVPRILVVDDDAAIRRGLVAELSTIGYETSEAADGCDGFARFRADAPDLVLTDLAMPRTDGYELIASIRKLARTPIVVLSVRGSDIDKVRALDLGADDYVVKPFSLQELLARVRSHLRRTLDEGAGEPLEFPGLTIDRDRRLVVVEGREMRLTPTEFSILEFLALRAGKPVTILQIVGRVWRGAPGTTPDAVRVHVGSLRRKLEPDPARPRFILTEPWVGYRFVAEPLPRESDPGP
jgi:two-component system KDP operon response regulator KdpE